MKKTLLTLLLLCGNLAIYAQSIAVNIGDSMFKANDLFFTITDSILHEVAVRSHPGDIYPYWYNISGGYIIPDTITDSTGTQYTVTAIGKRAFYGSYFTYLTIPSTIRSIGEDAFSGLAGVDSLFIPSSVTYIGSEAFTDCWKLKHLVVDSLNPHYRTQNNILYTIGMDTLFTVPAKIPLDTIVIPSSVRVLANGAFIASHIRAVYLPDSLLSIGKYCFSQDTLLTEMHIPASVSYIGGGAFAGCHSLYNLTIDSNNTHYIISNNCIYTPTQDTLVSSVRPSGIYRIPEGVKVVECHAFFSSTRITELYLPASLHTIRSGAFHGCFARIIHFQEGLKNIEDNAFYECKNLKDITLPNSLSKLGKGAFSNCTSTVSITLPDSLEEIRPLTFGGLISLQSITWGQYLRKIGNDAFLSDSKLAAGSTLEFPTSIRVIGEFAFCDCSQMTKIKFSDVIDTIYNEAFSSMTNLQSIVLQNETPPVRTSDGIFSYSPLRTVYVPCGAGDNYREDSFWSQYRIVELPCPPPEDTTGHGNTAISLAEDTPVHIHTEGNTIIIEDASTTPIAVYDLIGRQVALTAPSGTSPRRITVPTTGTYILRITVPTTGTYILRIGNRSHKVMVHGK